MKAELQNKLFEEFPSLFREKDLSPQKTCMCWGIDTGDGWYDLIHNTCEKLMKTEGAENFRFVQVKEKFGGLRLYTGAATDEQFDIINKAEEESYHTCEWCGSKENITTSGGWLITLCDDCRQKRDEGYRPWHKERESDE